MPETIRIGSRGSDLALWQAHFVQQELAAFHIHSEIKIIKTQGDKIQHLSLEKLEGKGFFTKEIEDALLNNEIDIAVHSHKDLPTIYTEGLIIAGVSHREDASELLLIKKESVDESKYLNLKQHAIVGTSSARRMVQLKFFRDDLTIHDIRGNVPTRIDKLRNGNFDAIMLAYAGVKRLNLDVSDLHAEIIAPEEFIPAPAQGVLAYQCRENDSAVRSIIEKIHHPDILDQIEIERKIMQLFQGGCHMPLGVYCKKNNDLYQLWASQAYDKIQPLKRIYTATHSKINLPESIFEKLKEPAHKSIFITRQLEQESAFYKLLVAKGFSLQGKSFVTIHKIEVSHIPETDWLFFTSKNGVEHFFEQISNLPPHTKIAAIGNETAMAIKKYNYKLHFTGQGTIENIVKDFLTHAQQKRILFPQAKYARQELMTFIQEKNEIIPLPVYENTAKPESIASNSDIIIFTSPLNADAFFTANKITPQQIVIAIGQTTQKHVSTLIENNILIPHYPNLLSVADLICGL